MNGQFSKYLFSNSLSRNLLLGGILSSIGSFHSHTIHAEEQTILQEESFINLDAEDSSSIPPTLQTEQANLPSEVTQSTTIIPTSETTVFQAEIVPDPKSYIKKHRKYGCLRFGAPSEDNLKYREGYVSSYNRRTRTANWVGESLKAESLIGGSADRVNSTFKEDSSDPPHLRAKLTDYRGSGYDRGHLVPAADLKFSQRAMNETFYLSNISPQVGKGFNTHYWARLEKFCRDLTKTW